MNTKTNMIMMSVALVIAPFAILAQQNGDTKTDKAARKAQIKEAMRRKTGGMILRKDVAKGKIVFIDAQTVYDGSNVTAVAAVVGKATRFTTESKKNNGGIAAELKERFGADVLVMAVNDQKSPVLLVAPEECWAVVNVARLDEGLKTDAAKAKFVESRFRKELLKAFAFAAGGTSSQFPDNVMQAVSVSDLDLCHEVLPYDSQSKAVTAMKKMGMVPMAMSTYRQACQQGWAPAPTNEYQKAIWDKVHELPTKPIKILPETKPVKE